MSRTMNPSSTLIGRRIPISLTLISLTLFLVVWLLPSVDAQRATPADTKATNPIDNGQPITPVLPCCGKKPPLKDIPGYSTSTYAGFTGQVAVATNYADTPNKPSVVIWDLTNQTLAPLGVQWQPTQTNLYFHPDWTRTKIGDVFGVTLDSRGNIYAAASRVFGFNNIGSSLISGTTPGNGDVYKLNGNTGAATRFIQTNPVATYTIGNKLPNTGPGLGQIDYSCDHDKLYVSNFEDGLIYRIDPNTGSILSTFNHGQNLPTASPARAAIVDSSTNGYTALGRRVWALKVLKGKNRLFYSVWSEDQGRTLPLNPPNEIWSIGLNPSTGAFVGSARLEITLPSLNAGSFSNPVADISFNVAGTSMLVAERTMVSDTSPSAHQSRGLEYTLVSGVWTPELVNKYSIGAFSGINSAGGADFDDGPNGRTWFSGDALVYITTSHTYGIQGSLGPPRSAANSILIDLDNDISGADKQWIGDVDIPCFQCDVVPSPPVILPPDSGCAKNGQYCVQPIAGMTYTWNVTGGTPSTATGSCIGINWGSTTPKVITVTATNVAGCSSTTTLTLPDCINLYLGDCCLDFQSKVELKKPVDLGNGVYDVTSTITVGPPSIIRVTANVISSSLTFSAPSCGTAGPVNSYVTSAQVAGNFPASIPVTNGHEVIWHGPASNFNSVPFTMQIKFPPPPTSLHCRDYLTFCVKYTFTDKNCKTCEVIVCYGPFQRGGPIKNTGEVIDIKVVHATP